MWRATNRLDPLDGVDPLDEVDPLGLEVVWRDAEHDAVLPPLLPAQFQRHGLLPVTVDAVPALQRLVVGALVRVAPFEEPQTPFTPCADASFTAEQVAVVPPLLPVHVHDHALLPLTADAVPALQRFVVGALARLAPFEEPHAPLTVVVVATASVA